MAACLVGSCVCFVCNASGTVRILIIVIIIIIIISQKASATVFFHVIGDAKTTCNQFLRGENRQKDTLATLDEGEK